MMPQSWWYTLHSFPLPSTWLRDAFVHWLSLAYLRKHNTAAAYFLFCQCVYLLQATFKLVLWLCFLNYTNNSYTEHFLFLSAYQFCSCLLSLYVQKCFSSLEVTLQLLCSLVQTIYVHHTVFIIAAILGPLTSPCMRKSLNVPFWRNELLTSSD